MKLRTKAADILDSPGKWDHYYRPWFNVKRFQQQIDDRIGLNRDGRSIVVLRWGQDVHTTAFYESTPRYWLKRQRQPDGTYTYWTVMRWVLEIRMEPEAYAPAWIASRYSLRDPTTGGDFTCLDCGRRGDPVLSPDGKVYCQGCVSTNVIGGSVIDKGPPPAEFYSYLSDCAVHEAATDRSGRSQCCVRAMYSDTRWGKSGMRCWGSYRQPGDLDLQMISQLAHNMQANKYREMYRELSPAELAECELASNMQVEAEKERFDAYERELMVEFNRLHGHHLLGEPGPGFVDLGKSYPKAADSGIVLTDS